VRGDGSSIVTKVLYVEDNDDNVFMLKMHPVAPRLTPARPRPVNVSI
jgi:hypothetical protein